MGRESRGRRSFGYRSFITCEDPRGVVESGTIRKPKHGKKLVESDRSKNRNLPSVGGVEAQNPASFRLLEVSRSSQKLNNVISSWSNGHSRNNSREIAQDLLKGALDLGESLSMLSRLQQSSNDMSESTKKQQKQKIERDSSEEACDGPSTSSSRSSIVHPSKFVAPASKKKNKKTKRSNLIAKLMGLEEASLRSLSHMGEGEKILKEKKTAFDHDPEESSGWKRRPALDQMIEAVKSKGLPKRWSDVVSDDRPPIVILRPSTFSCLDLEQPVIPKSRAEVFEEMVLGMRTRTNPLAQTDECETLSSVKETPEAKEAKPKEMTSSLGKSRPHKKQLVDRKKRGDDMKVSMLQSATAKYGRRGAKNTGNSEKNWPENIPKAVNKNGSRRYRDDEYGELDINCGRESLQLLSVPARITEDASQIEITDYDDYDQSSPSETPLLFDNQMNTESALTIMNECGGIDQDEGSHSSTIIRPIGGGNVCCKDNHSPSSRVTASLGSVYLPSGPRIDRLKDLLLSSQPFIKRVEAFLDSKVNPDTCLLQQVDSNVDHNDVSARELLDTANELVELHGFRCSRACLPLPWTAHKTSSITRYHYSSLEQLLDQVCDEIEALRRNRKDEGDDHSTDTLLLLVKGDLRSTRMVGGVWDMGWTITGSADQLEEITRGVDELLLDGLIDEILVDLGL